MVCPWFSPSHDSSGYFTKINNSLQNLLPFSNVEDIPLSDLLPFLPYSCWNILCKISIGCGLLSETVFGSNSLLILFSTKWKKVIKFLHSSFIIPIGWLEHRLFGIMVHCKYFFSVRFCVFAEVSFIPQGFSNHWGLGFSTY